MSAVLDIGPLRSLVAVADSGGFQRAASTLHLSQAAVSQHVRRLEAAVGHPLVERHGRGSRFTAPGELLVAQARRILALHDETLRGFDVEIQETVTVGCTEHAAAQLLPHLAAALEESAPAYQFRFRIDRGARLRENVATGTIDLALLLNVDGPRSPAVGQLDLTWYSAPTWPLPAEPDAVALVAFDSPCALRTRALETLSAAGIPAVVGAEAASLAGVHAAVAAGLGVALLATFGQTPAGLVPRDDLPTPEPLRVHVCSRSGLPEQLSALVSDRLRRLLAPELAVAVGA
jgi:DNA-binding transcriptional LysR family regulator